MIPSECTYFILVELHRIIPTAIIIKSLNLLINPKIFDTEYKKHQYDTDKYFNHLSNASPEEIRELTVEMSNYNATKELVLISTKILLAAQEFSYLDEVAATNICSIEKSEWLKYFYYNQGNMLNNQL